MVPVPVSPHFWTIAPNLLGRLRPTLVDDKPWSVEIRSSISSSVTLAGALGDPHRASRLLVVVHGLGGDADSPYVRELLGAAHERARDEGGWATLRLSMRGAGSSSPDFYHAGLWTDLDHAIADRSLARFESIVVVGCSLGGHIALHLAHTSTNPRLRGVVAICSPLDLAPNAAVLDAPRAFVYRRHILSGLERGYAKIHGRRQRFGSIREWDARVVVPRWGFDSVEQYWASQSIGPRLAELRVPSLYVGATGDPVVPSEIQRPHLERARAKITSRWLTRAGHVGFAPGVDLGMGGQRGIWPQVLSWCERTVV